jgi:multicomponent K+:H+ antiporter subunit E
MRSWRSYSLLLLVFTGMWLVLNQTAALSHWLLGVVIAGGAVGGYALLRPPLTPVRRFGLALQLAFLVLTDLVRSNFDVARIVFRAHSRPPTAGFLNVALETRNPAALAVLACIITSTPGTAWSGYDSERGILRIHILDLIDEQAWIAIIKERYERRLLEIFP